MNSKQIPQGEVIKKLVVFLDAYREARIKSSLQENDPEKQKAWEKEKEEMGKGICGGLCTMWSNAIWIDLVRENKERQEENNFFSRLDNIRKMDDSQLVKFAQNYVDYEKWVESLPQEEKTKIYKSFTEGKGSEGPLWLAYQEQHEEITKSLESAREFEIFASAVLFAQDPDHINLNKVDKDQSMVGKVTQSDVVEVSEIVAPDKNIHPESNFSFAFTFEIEEFTYALKTILEKMQMGEVIRLTSHNHAMQILVGDNKEYAFFDPNEGVTTYKDVKNLAEEIQRYFSRFSFTGQMSRDRKYGKDLDTFGNSFKKEILETHFMPISMVCYSLFKRDYELNREDLINKIFEMRKSKYSQYKYHLENIEIDKILKADTPAIDDKITALHMAVANRQHETASTLIRLGDKKGADPFLKTNGSRWGKKDAFDIAGDDKKIINAMLLACLDRPDLLENQSRVEFMMKKAINIGDFKLAYAIVEKANIKTDELKLEFIQYVMIHSQNPSEEIQYLKQQYGKLLDQAGNDLFYKAMEKNDIKLFEVLINSGLSLIIPDKDKKTILDIVSFYQRPIMIELIFDKLKEINALDFVYGIEGRHPPLTAIMLGDYGRLNDKETDKLDNTLAFLMKSKENNLDMQKILSPVYNWLISNDRGKELKLFLECCIQVGLEIDANQIKALILASKNPNLQDMDGRTILHYAFLSGNEGLFKESIKGRGPCDINIRDNEGNTALHIAIEKDVLHTVMPLGEYPIMKAALFNQINKPDLSLQNNNGDTLLHLAVRKGYVELVEELLHYHPNVLLTNKNNESPLSIAISSGNADIINMLSNAEKLLLPPGMGEKKTIVFPQIISKQLDDYGIHAAKNLESAVGQLRNLENLTDSCKALMMNLSMQVQVAQHKKETGWQSMLSKMSNLSTTGLNLVEKEIVDKLNKDCQQSMTLLSNNDKKYLL